MSQSYAYNANNPGHLYLNSPEFEKDLEAAAKSMKLSKEKAYIMKHWSDYNIVSSAEEMKKLLNILEAHGETLDSMHDVAMGNTEFCCGVWFGKGGAEDREVVHALFEHDVFYDDMESLHAVVKEEAEDVMGISLAEYMDGEDIRVTSDGVVRVLQF